MSTPFDPMNDTLDLLTCLEQIVKACPSARARGTARGLRQASEFEAARASYAGSALLQTYPKLLERLASWEGPLAERVKARLQVHHARLSGR